AVRSCAAGCTRRSGRATCAKRALGAGLAGEALRTLRTLRTDGANIALRSYRSRREGSDTHVVERVVQPRVTGGRLRIDRSVPDEDIGVATAREPHDVRTRYRIAGREAAVLAPVEP